MRTLIFAALVFAAPAIADEVTPNGDVALTACASSAGTLVRELAVAKGQLATLTEQAKAKDAEIAALQRQIEARPKDTPK